MSNFQSFCIGKLGFVGSMLKCNHGTNKKQLLWFYSEFRAKKKEKCPFSHVKGLGRATHVAGWHYTLVEKKPYCIISFAQVMQIRVVLNGTKTGSGHLLLPATLPTHGAFWADGKRITTTPLCLLVSLMAGAGEHHSPECSALAKC